MKKPILALAFLALVPAVHATTVTLSSAASGPSVFLPGGTGLVPNGSVIRVGTLTNPNDFSTFIEFGTSTVKNAGIGASAQPGKVTGSVTNANGETDDNQFNNLPVYVWVYNAATLPPDSASRELIAQGLFRSSDTNFPANDPAGVGDAATATAVSFTATVNLPFLASQASVNMTGDNGTGNPTGGRFVLGAPVPEPSVSLLGLGAAMLVGLRRRR
jgi:hypothetical protein